MLASKPCSTPMIKSNQSLFDPSAPPYDAAAYRRLIGRLLYLTTTQPDISFAVQQHNQFMQAPKQSHYEAALRIIRYIYWNLI